MPLLTPAEIDRIASLGDAAARNREITLGYHALSLAVRERTGSAANWLAFAAWASRQAGDTIRGEDARRLLERTLDEVGAGDLAEEVVSALRTLGARPQAFEIRRRLRTLVDVDAAARRASAAVARGNVKVFAEIGRHFSEYIATRLADAEPDDAALRRFTDGLRPGDPPEGQQLLRQAFAHMYEAMFEADVGRRRELVLLANLEIGLHEQTRLQPEIEEALNVAVPDGREIGDRLIAELFPWGGRIARFRLALRRLLGGKTPLDRALEGFVEGVRGRLRRALTEHVMTLELAGGEVLRLGRDHAGPRPPQLADPSHPELVALLSRVAAPSTDLRQSGAADWADFAERMYYIAELFRVRLLDDRLYVEPPMAALPA